MDEDKQKGNVIARQTELLGMIYELCDENWNVTGYVFVEHLPDTHEWEIRIG